MNKKKLLMTLIILQGVLIVVGLLVIVYTIFIKVQDTNVKTYIVPESAKINDIQLINENQFQIKRIENNQIIFDIYDLENSNIVNTIILNEN
ncbi:MAG: hypothetical protein P8J53_04220 [Alphaproteobacteria bacterium]|mgnify:FL=1|jgi:hypothetical protein|nr:hypothetical protein [Alphaproteobacteria bacterium]|tara:strand:- start:16 stop:291 length:276 start_codon:yes stop_codon:yes gene_type:complete